MSARVHGSMKEENLGSTLASPRHTNCTSFVFMVFAFGAANVEFVSRPILTHWKIDLRCRKVQTLLILETQHKISIFFTSTPRNFLLFLFLSFSVSYPALGNVSTVLIFALTFLFLTAKSRNFRPILNFWLQNFALRFSPAGAIYDFFTSNWKLISYLHSRESENKTTTFGSSRVQQQQLFVPPSTEFLRNRFLCFSHFSLKFLHFVTEF